MTIYSASGPLVTHQYCFLQPNAIGEHDWIQVAWFGIASFPGRMWGAHVLLECGAIYRNVPLHHLAHQRDAAPWSQSQAQTWDCYGNQFSTVEYPYLTSRQVRAKLRDKSEHRGQYICTLIPIGDPWSSHPDQSKEFTLIALQNGRYTCQPTNHVLVEDASFTTTMEWPKWLRRQTKVWSAESTNA